MVKNLPASAGDARNAGSIPWGRKWQLTPEFLPGKSQGEKSLVGCSLWGCKELDTTEHVHTYIHAATKKNLSKM